MKIKPSFSFFDLMLGQYPWASRQTQHQHLTMCFFYGLSSCPHFSTSAAERSSIQHLYLLTPSHLSKCCWAGVALSDTPSWPARSCFDQSCRQPRSTGTLHYIMLPSLSYITNFIYYSIWETIFQISNLMLTKIEKQSKN